MEEKKKKSEAKRRDGDWLKIKEKEAARSSDSFPSTADSQWKAGSVAGTVTVWRQPRGTITAMSPTV